MAKTKKTALFILAVFSLILIFATGFTLKSVDHDCQESDCQICYAINNIENSIKGLMHFAVQVLIVSSVGFAIVLSLGNLKKFSFNKTLIDLQVKLSD